ncbi:hypothetical protein QTH97_32380 [Variovorax sp. J22R24]|uniref:hypothetical protein n=1 Tax=Variovorax gracilis TaxID=3053502 RepID=UPI002574BCAA|nr:hypothetical protein [Variovorax sp. J22R24]MDM0109656.1 hypothetical protein [Variovorax sp. J22R24]
MFDLRQVITGAWLDSQPVPLSQVRRHDFGGGPDAGMMVLAVSLPAGTRHTLRVTYTLATPQASTAGSYQPRMLWTTGPRLAFNFGFTDLGAGRYLEAWVPANLIYDQFELHLSLHLVNTALAHQVISNGMVTSTGPNQWEVHFPQRFTALSPLLELRAADTVTSMTGNVSLPVSGATVVIEAWKLVSGTADLPTQIANLRTWLADNESRIGPYVHGNRFVVFLNVGGMEYEGGTTSSPGALRHEAFHSWWARGVKPASQADAWWDEAWTTFNIDTPPVAAPFDFAAPPVELCPHNPWIRTTASASYTSGDRLFEGLAALVGVSALEAHMRELYARYRGALLTTAMMEEFLLCRTGEPLLVDAFHRFVYGMPDAVRKPDLWLRDAASDTGGNGSARFWDSPDLWIRHRDDGGTTHQSPEFGQDNWFYARVRNRGRGVARHFVVTFNVKHFAGTQFAYPDDFLPCVAAITGFDLGPGQSTVVKARWPREQVPPPGAHACWLAAVIARGDHPLVGRHVNEHNNLAQKNLTIVDLRRDEWILVPFVARNVHSSATRRYVIEVRRSAGAEGVEAVLVHQNGRPFDGASARAAATRSREPADLRAESPARGDCGAEYLPDEEVSASGAADILTSRTSAHPRLTRIAQGIELPFDDGAAAGIPVVLRAREQIVPALRVRVPRSATPGRKLQLDLVQRDARTRKVMGGLAIELHVK